MAYPIFVEAIVGWYQLHKRDLPWRNTNDPYQIWLSEIILQQTRVIQGKPYYEKFVSAYPTVKDLAQAPEDEVLRLWQGLGYYSRARNLHATAKYITYECNEQFPTTYEALLKLKGVGKYTAAAIASFAFKEPVAVLDGNVFRVLARYFGIETDISSPKGSKVFGELSQSLIPQDIPDSYNQAIMEFGALQCTPQKPNCMYCPLAEGCEAFRTGRQAVLPVKQKKIKVKKRYIRYYLFNHKENFLLKKRSKDDIWGGLYDFYAVEATSAENLQKAIAQEDFLQQQKNNLLFRKESKQYTHILTHQKLYVVFQAVEVVDREYFEQEVPSQYTFFSWTAVSDLPKPILIAKYLNNYQL